MDCFLYIYHEQGVNEKNIRVLNKNCERKPLDVQKTNITYSHVMEALGPKGKDLDEKENGKDVLLITKSKKTWLHVGTTICFFYFLIGTITWV